MQKKIILAIATLIMCVAMIGIFALPSIATWTGNSVAQTTSSTATDTFSTSAYFAGTNAQTSAVTINGQSFTSTSATNVLLTGPNSGDPNNPSTVPISASGFVPGDYAIVQVNVKNTGTVTLQFSNYVMNCYFVNPGDPNPSDSTHAITYTFPSNDPYSANYVDKPHNINVPGTWDFTSTGWDNAATQSAMTATFLTYLNNEATVGCANTWCGDNAFIGSALPSTLAPGATFTYYIYVGLGAQTVYGIPPMFYSISIPMTAVQ